MLNYSLGKSKCEHKGGEDRLTLLIAHFGLFALILFSAIGLQPFQVGDSVDQGAGGDSLRQILFVLFFLAALFVVIDRDKPGIRPFLPSEWLFVLLICCASSVWALDPSISIRRVLLTAFVVMSVFAFVKVLTPPRAVIVTWYALAAILVINYISVALVPAAVHLAVDFTDESIIGAWRGAVRHKNIAGPLCVMTCFYALFVDRVAKWQRLGISLLAIIFLIKSQSKTSMGIGLVSVAFTYVVLLMRRLPKGLVLLEAGLMLLIGAAFLWTTIPLIGAALSDGTALTGRASIWPALVGFLERNWLLGAGYGSFWAIGDRSPIYEFAAGWVTALAQGHNGYLDLAVQVGVPLAVIIIVIGLLYPLIKLFNAQRVAGDATRIALASAFFVIGQNFTETTFLDRDAPVFVMLLIAIGLTDRNYWELGAKLGNSHLSRESVVLSSKATLRGKAHRTARIPYKFGKQKLGLGVSPAADEKITDKEDNRD